MKVLLIGPCPPPHGGISVHVRGLEEQHKAAGVTCAVFDSARVNPRMIGRMFTHAWHGWTLHLHTNGHNRNSWILALMCGIAGRCGHGCTLTLHSGMVPRYLGTAPFWRRAAAGAVCMLYSRIICVNDAIQHAVAGLGVPLAKIVLANAYLGARLSGAPLSPKFAAWLNHHSPRLSTAMFFRPEYGFEVLLAAIGELRRECPSIGCLVMGDSDNRHDAERLIREAGLEANILLAGDVDHDTCLNIMARCDAFIRPTFEDGDSISVREAFGLGVPVIASSVGTRPEGTILFPPGDAAALALRIRVAADAGLTRVSRYA